MQALDSFISPVPDFNGDILILAVSVLAQRPGDETVCDPYARASASASKTQASKWKATAKPIPQKKAKKATWRSSRGIRIDKSAPKAPALTPPSGIWTRILIHHSKRYTRHDYVSSLTTS
jgi:hypothetical protein